MTGFIDTDAADLIDAIVNRGMQPYAYSGRGMFGLQCVACTLPRGSDLSGLPRAGAVVDQMGRDYVVYWPGQMWAREVRRYVETICDESGRALDEDDVA